MDKPRDPASLRKQKIRRIGMISAGVAALAAVSVAVAMIDPAAYAVERESVWTEKVQRGTFVRQVRGPAARFDGHTLRHPVTPHERPDLGARVPDPAPPQLAALRVLHPRRA